LGANLALSQPIHITQSFSDSWTLAFVQSEVLPGDAPQKGDGLLSIAVIGSAVVAGVLLIAVVAVIVKRVIQRRAVDPEDGPEKTEFDT
jgi:hypothetical protein